MAKKKQEDPPKGSPAWMSTFSDLMNLLLCFFVLLFSMSTIEEEKFMLVIASLQSHFSVLQGGAASVGDGDMVSAGVNQLQQYDTYFNPDNNTNGKGKYDTEGFKPTESDSPHSAGLETDEQGGNPKENKHDAVTNEATPENEKKQDRSDVEVEDEYEKKGLAESERDADNITEELKKYGLQNQVEVTFNSQYTILTLSGAVLFESGDSELLESSYPIIDKVGLILNHYTKHEIEVEGHTDNVPIHNSKYEDNNVLSMYRALAVADYLRDVTIINDQNIKSSGRGDYFPIADNTTPEGRALNRRVVIKIYNTLNSDV